MRSSPSSLNLQYPFFALSLARRCVHLLPRLPVTSILSSTFNSITCFRWQFLRKMWPIHLAFLPSFLLLYVGYTFPPCLSIILLHFSHDQSLWSPPQLSPAPLKTFQVLLIYCPKWPSFSITESYARFSLKFTSNLLVKRVFSLNAPFALAILDLIRYHATQTLEVHTKIYSKFCVLIHKLLQHVSANICSHLQGVNTKVMFS